MQQYMNKRIKGLLAAMLAMAVSVQAADEDRIKALEQQMEAANAEIAALKGEKNDLSAVTAPASKLTLGGYGEIHANFSDGGNSTFDIHRLVLYAGYEFADWIRLVSETELEHAFVSSGSGGEISIEQLYVDFLLSDPVNIRAGRILAPLGIINQHHEPTLFFGVERPSFAHDIIPTTWSLDGIGVFGSPLSWLTYEAYVVAGLNGSGFDGSEGIREGRNKERQGLDDPAITGRIDVFPIVEKTQNLRIGLSGYHGGTDNANKGGAGSPSVDNTFTMVSADFDYEVSRFIFRGVVAQGSHSDAADINAAYTTDAGEEILGWYLESGVSVMPQSWKTGKLKESDIVPFVRYEWYDTQHKVPAGTAKDDANERTDVTVGVNWLLNQQFVVKADIHFLSDEANGSDVDNKYNLGIGWVFQ